MSEKLPNQPAWEDITISEIQQLLTEERIATALTLARLRLDGIQNIPTEIRLSVAALGDIPATKWMDELQAFELEIRELTEIISNYTK